MNCETMISEIETFCIAVIEHDRDWVTLEINIESEDRGEKGVVNIITGLVSKERNRCCIKR